MNFKDYKKNKDAFYKRVDSSAKSDTKRDAHRTKQMHAGTLPGMKKAGHVGEYRSSAYPLKPTSLKSKALEAKKRMEARRK